MSTKTNKLLLALMILALVITPMRGAWALSTTTSDDSTTHCAQMDMPSDDMHAGMHHPDTGTDSGHQCDAGCNGDCCDGSCNTCAHSVISLPDSVVVARNTHAAPLAVRLAAAFPHRSLIPPLRPPASL